uniref:Transmembrane protein n=1 Tax=Pan troglodytes TaxID=9598 RepID=A0A2I3S7F2_PANTR
MFVQLFYVLFCSLILSVLHQTVFATTNFFLHSFNFRSNNYLFIYFLYFLILYFLILFISYYSVRYYSSSIYRYILVKKEHDIGHLGKFYVKRRAFIVFWNINCVMEFFDFIILFLFFSNYWKFQIWELLIRSSFKFNFQVQYICL